MLHVVVLKKDTLQIVEDDLDSPVGGIPHLGVIASSWSHNPDHYKGFFEIGQRFTDRQCHHAVRILTAALPFGKS